MKFDNLYKFIVNEALDTKDLEDNDELSQDNNMGSEDSQIEDVIEELELHTNADLTEEQKQALAQKAIQIGLYDKFKQGKITKEDAVDLLINLNDEEGDDIDLELDTAEDVRDVKNTAKRSSGWEDEAKSFGRDLDSHRQEREFASGVDY